jgi:orotate phosphoribosyltransferase
VILLSNLAKEITHLLYDIGAIRTWLKDNPKGWILHSEKWSPFYIQLRGISSYPDSKKTLHKIASAMGNMVKEEIPETSRMVGVAMAGIPIAIAITMITGIPSCYTRSTPAIRKVKDFDAEIEKLKKKYGEPRFVEGEIASGDNLLIVDDLVTDFESKLIAKKFIDYECSKRQLDVTCNNVAVLFDREQGAKENARKVGMNLFSLIPFRSKGMEWLKDKMSIREYEVITDYLGNPKKYQNQEVQQELASEAMETKY